jgi:hypothetical protein
VERLVEIEGLRLAHTHLLRMIAVNNNVDILNLQGPQLAPHVLYRQGVGWIDPFQDVLARYEKSLDVFHLRKPHLNLIEYVVANFSKAMLTTRMMNA